MQWNLLLMNMHDLSCVLVVYVEDHELWYEKSILILWTLHNTLIHAYSWSLGTKSPWNEPKKKPSNHEILKITLSGNM